ncbi:MAG: sugar phosphate nucleotidyltransferase [Patescibacteria group bacterium]|jgi:mannose-1-phosphate guanylyltransferase
MKIMILAGGGGTRLWPVSRKNRPKQIQPFIGNKTLLQLTYNRIRTGFLPKDIFISSNIKQKNFIQNQIPGLPKVNYILEPAKKDTAAAIGLAAVYLAKKNPQEVMMMANSDGYIKNIKEYIRLLRLAEKIVSKNPEQTLLLGIRPTYPETGYGYIKINKLFRQAGNDEIFYGEKFIEKPDLPTAKKYMKRWDYLWNPAMFCWRVDYLLSLFKKYLPQHYQILMKIHSAIGTSRENQVLIKEFAKIKPISIDYGIMEKTKKIIVIPADFDWTDIGHWRAVKDVLANNEKDNVIKGQAITVDSENNLIYGYSGRLIATAGVKDMIIIDMEDCVLVCPKEKAQDVKKIVEKLEKHRIKKLL